MFKSSKSPYQSDVYLEPNSIQIDPTKVDDVNTLHKIRTAVERGDQEIAANLITLHKSIKVIEPIAPVPTLLLKKGKETMEIPMDAELVKALQKDGFKVVQQK
tara:strand:- start:296 stop:604 length:309 start_codon:yes stop_codon:yes gene_type:complete